MIATERGGAVNENPGGPHLTLVFVLPTCVCYTTRDPLHTTPSVACCHRPADHNYKGDCTHIVAIEIIHSVTPVIEALSCEIDPALPAGRDRSRIISSRRTVLSSFCIMPKRYYFTQ